MSSILLVEEDVGTQKILTTVMKTEGYKVATAAVAGDAAAVADAGGFGLMIADIAGYAAEDIAVIKAVAEAHPGMSLIVITTGEQDISPLLGGDLMFHATKPLKMDMLLAAVQKALDYSESDLEEMGSLRMELETSYQFSNVVAESPSMRSVCEMINRIATTDVSVLISGESGTGKELVAKTIHENSMRKDEMFVPVDCAEADQGAVDAILFGKGNVSGSFEDAEGGTVFLGGIDSLPPQVQAKVLTALKERSVSRVDSDNSIPVNVRVITSAGDPVEAVRAGRLNPELFAMLRAIMITIPALRDRKDDVEPLVARLIQRSTEPGAPAPMINQPALQLLTAYAWPGNVAQLQEVVQHAMGDLRDGMVTADSMPAYIRESE